MIGFLCLFSLFLCGIIKNGKISESGETGSITSFGFGRFYSYDHGIKPVRQTEICKQILKKQEQKKRKEVIEGEKKKMT